MKLCRCFLFILFSVLLFSIIVVPDTSADDSVLRKGIADYRSENYEEAIALLAVIPPGSPDYSVASFYIGLSYKQTGRYHQAEEYFKAAISSVPYIKDAYVELIEVLYSNDQLSDAKEWITKAEKENVKPGQVAFLKGLISQKEGRSSEALECFSKAKEADPSLSQSADLQMALIHTKERRFTEAQKALGTILTINPNSEIASFAREYERAIARRKEMHKAWRFTLGVAYTYDDNVIASPSTNIPGISADAFSGARDESVINTLKIEYSPLLDGPYFVNVQYNLYSNLYAHTTSHSLFLQSLTVIPGLNFSNGAFTIPLTYNHIWLGGQQYMSLVSISPTVTYVFLPGHIGQFSAGFSLREMIKSQLDDEDRDGKILSFSAAYIRPFSEGRGMYNLKYEFSKENTDGKNWDNIGNRFTASLLVPLVQKLNLVATGDAFFQDYSNVNSEFNKKRRDSIYTGSVNFIYQIMKGLNMNFQYAHVRDDSNIAIYDYNRNVYTAGFEYNF